MCPSRIAMYGERMLLPLACLLLHSGQPALFARMFYLFLGFTLGHWVSGTETGLSVLFLYNGQHRHIWHLKLLVVLYVMPVIIALIFLLGICRYLCTWWRCDNHKHTDVECIFLHGLCVILALNLALNVGVSLVVYRRCIEEVYRKHLCAGENSLCWPVRARGWWGSLCFYLQQCR